MSVKILRGVWGDLALCFVVCGPDETISISGCVLRSMTECKCYSQLFFPSMDSKRGSFPQPKAQAVEEVCGISVCVSIPRSVGQSVGCGQSVGRSGGRFGGQSVSRVAPRSVGRSASVSRSVDRSVVGRSVSGGESGARSAGVSLAWWPRGGMQICVF